MTDNAPGSRPPKAGQTAVIGRDPPPRIPDHELLRCIGSGSYGEVWLGRNVMGTYRAVKVVYRENFQNERPYEREFSGIKKYEPVSRTHDDLIDILQVGRNDHGGYYYYVMELSDDSVSGQNIDPASYEAKTLEKEMLTRGRLPFEECLRLGLSLAGGLGHLHKHGLIHRDIKPSNIIFVNGIPKIADIGLVADAGSGQSFVGTEGFIPPEGPGTAQADIYSLGKVLYEISSGKDRQIFPELPTGLDEVADQKEYLELNEVILKACDADYRKRYKSAEEMQADLVLLQAGKSVKHLRVLERRYALARKFGVVVVLLMLIGSGAYYQARWTEKQTRYRLAESYVAYGKLATEKGDLFGSLPWFAAALGVVQGDPKIEEPHRIRMATVLQFCPKITRTIFEESVVYWAQLSPSGQRVVTACSDHTANVWDLSTGRRLLQLRGHTDEVETACFSPDERFVLTASVDRTARLWDARSGELLATFPHPAKVSSAAFNSRGDQILTACGDGQARIWDRTTTRLIGEYGNHTQAIRHAAYSPDDRQIVTASEDKTAQVWDVATRRPVGRPLEHEHWVYQACFSPDGRYVVTASYDRSARVWDLRSGLQIWRWEHNGPVHSAQFSPDGRYVVTGGWEENTARIWDFETGKEVNPSLKHCGYVNQASFSPDGRCLVTASDDHTVRRWDLSARFWLPPLVPYVFSPDGQRFASRSNNVVRLAGLTSDPAAYPAIVTDRAVTEIALNRDGSRVVTLFAGPETGAAERSAQLWQALAGRALGRPFTFDGSLTNAALSDDGRRLVLFGGNVAELRDAATGALLARLPHTGQVEEASFDPTGHILVTIDDNTARLWDGLTGGPVRVLRHVSKVSHAEFSFNGRYLATACSFTEALILPCAAQVWDVKNGALVTTNLVHNDDVLHVAFSPDGKRVVTASQDKYAQVWDAMTGQRIGPVLAHKHQVFDAEFSPDGRWVVTACNDGTARVWDVETGVPLTLPLQHGAPVKQARFIAQGRSILTTTKDGSSRIWELLPDTRSVEDLALMAQLLSGNQNIQAGGVLPLDPAATRQGWLRLQGRFPQNFSVSPDEIDLWQRQEANASEKWHGREAARCEREQLWFAARFHLDRLLVAHPQDKTLRDRRDRAQAHLNQAQ